MKSVTVRSIVLILLGLGTCLAACAGPPLAGATITAAPQTTIPNEEEPLESQSAATPEVSTPDAVEADSDSATATAYVAIVATPASEATTPTPTQPPVYTYEVVTTFPHDPAAFTQGLVYENDTLYEGTGRWGESTLREVDLTSGTVLRNHSLEDQFFGEGITLLENKIYQLTWQEQTGFIYDRATFEVLDTFTYPHEGWGITHDGRRLIVSDGTPTIRFWDPDTLQEIGRITVHDNQGPLDRLNELEYVNGEIWANIWLTDRIARISPETGEVTGFIDLTGLLDTSTLTQPADVLNGIAYDATTNRLFVTGKLWPSLFEINVVPAS